ncbi:hypothetical protein Sta7437_1372 [Stanieria cyanosphaera PCC 7437]|uniref:Uncharacterized protein n=2 Tax=Stanieria cyanosphaera TaxID=102116 RepID=K9XS80_STAC7|nr:hypothetical protein Sta7437_1372 [Stanieria cyanosphaera PCC 7437]
MLHLAQIQKNPTSGEMELQFLAHQYSEKIWEVDEPYVVPLTEKLSLGEGVLVLVEYGEEKQIISISTATDWVLNLVKQYLHKNSINSQFLAAEQEKIEQWRQEITAQSLELNRRFLEIETRREQLQELEQTLKENRESQSSNSGT